MDGIEIVLDFERVSYRSLYLSIYLSISAFDRTLLYLKMDLRVFCVGWYTTTTTTLSFESNCGQRQRGIYVCSAVECSVVSSSLLPSVPLSGVYCLLHLSCNFD